MPPWSIKINNPNDPRKRMARIAAAVEDGVYEGMQEAVALCRRLGIQFLTDLKKVDRGITRQSIRGTVTRSPGVVRGVVSADAPWAQWIEKGRRGQYASFPGITADSANAAWPPVQVIRDWVKRKFRSLAPSGRTKSGRARRPKDVDINRVAFLVGRKIFQRGIRPSPFMAPALAAVKPLFPGILQRSVMASLAKVGP